MNKTAREELHDVQLQIEMDLESHLILKTVMALLEVPTYGELIRRSLQAYEFFDPQLPPTEAKEAPEAKNPNRTVKRIHVRLPLKTKERLDRIKDHTNSTYTETVNKAVLILAQLARKKEELMQGDDENDSDTRSKEDILHHALALL